MSKLTAFFNKYFMWIELSIVFLLIISLNLLDKIPDTKPIYTVLFLSLAVLYWLVAYYYVVNEKNHLWHRISYTVYSVYIMGMLFITNHWPGTHPILMLSSYAMLVLAIWAAWLHHKKEKKLQTNEIVRLVIFILLASAYIFTSVPIRADKTELPTAIEPVKSETPQ